MLDNVFYISVAFFLVLIKLSRLKKNTSSFIHVFSKNNFFLENVNLDLHPSCNHIDDQRKIIPSSIISLSRAFDKKFSFPFLINEQKYSQIFFSLVQASKMPIFLPNVVALHRMSNIIFRPPGFEKKTKNEVSLESPFFVVTQTDTKSNLWQIFPSKSNKLYYQYNLRKENALQYVDFRRAVRDNLFGNGVFLYMCHSINKALFFTLTQTKILKHEDIVIGISYFDLFQNQNNATQLNFKIKIVAELGRTLLYFYEINPWNRFYIASGFAIASLISNIGGMEEPKTISEIVKDITSNSNNILLIGVFIFRGLVALGCVGTVSGLIIAGGGVLVTDYAVAVYNADKQFVMPKSTEVSLGIINSIIAVDVIELIKNIAVAASYIWSAYSQSKMFFVSKTIELDLDFNITDDSIKTIVSVNSANEVLIEDEVFQSILKPYFTEDYYLG